MKVYMYILDKEISVTSGPLEKQTRSGIIRLPKNARKAMRVDVGTSITIINEVTGKVVKGVVKKVNKLHLEHLKEIRNKYGAEIGNIPLAIINKSDYNTLIEPVDPLFLLKSDNIKLKVGADPECLLIDKDSKIVTRADALPELTQDKYQPFGADGPDAEFRPPPAGTTRQLVKNLTTLIKKSSKWLEDTYPHLQLICGASYPDIDGKRGRPFFMGGHIHIELPSEVLEFHNKFDFISGIVTVLDETIGIPLIKLDRPSPEARRESRHHYGAQGDFRNKDHGFEWRVPSSVWLTNPKIAAAVIGSVHAVSEEIIKKFIEAQLDSSKVVKEFMITPDRVTRAKIINNNVYEVINSRDKINKYLNKLKKLTRNSKHTDHVEEFADILQQRKNDLNKIPLLFTEEWV